MASTAPLVPGYLAEVGVVSRLMGADPTEAQTHGNLLYGQPLKDTHSSEKGSSKELGNQTSKQKGLQMWTLMPKMTVSTPTFSHMTPRLLARVLGTSLPLYELLHL